MSWPCALALPTVFACRVSRRAHLVDGDLHSLAPFIERLGLGEVEHEAASRKIARDGLGIGAEQLDCRASSLQESTLNNRVSADSRRNRLRADYGLRSRASASAILISSPRGTGS